MPKKSLLTQIASDTNGATAIEYGLIAALVSIAAIAAMGSLGNALTNTFSYVSTQMASAQSGKL